MILPPLCCDERSQQHSSPSSGRARSPDMLACFCLWNEVRSAGMRLVIGLGASKSWEIPRLEVAITSTLSFLTQPEEAVPGGPFLPSHKVFRAVLQGACKKFNEEFNRYGFGCSEPLPDFQIQHTPAERIHLPESIAVTSASQRLVPARVVMGAMYWCSS